MMISPQSVARNVFLVALAFWPSALGAVEIKGKVLEVSGDDVKITRDAQLDPRVGDEVEIYFLIPGVDDVAQVATGKVSAIAAEHVAVKIEKANGKVVKGHLARISSNNPVKRSAEPVVQPPEKPSEVLNSLGMRLVLIPAGEFIMGFQESKDKPDADDPPHRVRITRPFYMGVHEVTVGNFKAFVEAAGFQPGSGMGYDPQTQSFVAGNQANKYDWQNTGWPQTLNHPVVNVSWHAAVAFCRWLSQKEGKTYRLPTEAEWEYACRAGTTTQFYSGDDEASLKGAANVADASLKGQLAVFRDPSSPGYYDYTAHWDDGFPFTAPVGSFPANRFGLYDMHGNVQEWCADWYGKDYYRNSPQEDPRGPEAGQTRVKRGGDWVDYPAICRSSFRRSEVPPENRGHFIGFRVVCEAGSPGPNLIQNPGFESGFANYKEEYYSAKTAKFTIDSSVAHSGTNSLKVVNNTPGGPHVYKTFVQTIGGLKPNTTYRMSFWVKSEQAKSRISFNLIMDGFLGGWRQKVFIKEGAYDWTQFSGTYNIGSSTDLVLRFATEDICTVWLDDIEVVQLP